MGRMYVGDATKPDGTVYTHRKLLKLGKAMALHAHRIGHTLTQQDYSTAASAWFAAQERRGLRLRGNYAEYLAELRWSAELAQTKGWFTASADKWTRWTRDPEFPTKPEERLLFAIRKHCEEAGKPDFYIGGPDAGLACKKSFRTGARLLRKLVQDGKLRLITRRGERRAFHAFEYRLVETTSAFHRQKPLPCLT